MTSVKSFMDGFAESADTGVSVTVDKFILKAIRVGGKFRYEAAYKDQSFEGQNVRDLAKELHTFAEENMIVTPLESTLDETPKPASDVEVKDEETDTMTVGKPGLIKGNTDKRIRVTKVEMEMHSRISFLNTDCGTSFSVVRSEDERLKKTTRKENAKESYGRALFDIYLNGKIVKNGLTCFEVNATMDFYYNVHLVLNEVRLAA